MPAGFVIELAVEDGRTKLMGSQCVFVFVPHIVKVESAVGNGGWIRSIGELRVGS